MRMSALTPKKYTYNGYRKARRVLPGMQIRFQYKGTFIKDVVESVFIMGEERLVFNTITGFRVPAKWEESFQVWVRED